MYKNQLDLTKIVLNASSDKMKFLSNIMKTASRAYDEAVEKDIQCISGELSVRYRTENFCALYGRKTIGTAEQSGGDLWTGLYHPLRERKTEKDFDWSVYDLYNEGKKELKYEMYDSASVTG